MPATPIIPPQSLKQASLAAARVTDYHSCPVVDPGPKPHVGGPILAGSPTVFIEGQMAARVGDPAQCNGPTDSIAKGSATVFINGLPAARRTDPSAHGGKIETGAGKTYIGDGPGDAADPSDCMKNASDSGAATVSAA